MRTNVSIARFGYWPDLRLEGIASFFFFANQDNHVVSYPRVSFPASANKWSFKVERLAIGAVTKLVDAGAKPALIHGGGCSGYSLSVYFIFVSVFFILASTCAAALPALDSYAGALFLIQPMKDSLLGT